MPQRLEGCEMRWSTTNSSMLGVWTVASRSGRSNGLRAQRRGFLLSLRFGAKTAVRRPLQRRRRARTSTSSVRNIFACRRKRLRLGKMSRDQKPRPRSVHASLQHSLCGLKHEVRQEGGCNHPVCVCWTHSCHVCGKDESALGDIYSHAYRMHGGAYDD